MNDAGAQRGKATGLSHTVTFTAETRTGTSAPAHVVSLLWPSLSSTLSPEFCRRFQNPLTQGCGHIGIDNAHDPACRSGWITWFEAPLLLDILFWFPARGFSHYWAFCSQKPSNFFKKSLFNLVLSRWSRWSCDGAVCARSVVLCVPTASVPITPRSKHSHWCLGFQHSIPEEHRVCWIVES